MDQRVATATARLLERRFQRTASHIAWAPGRVNLVGGHVDYNDGVVLPAAIDRGIYVANCPGKNADAVAELAIGLLVAADRQIVNANVDLRSGDWEKSKMASHTA